MPISSLTTFMNVPFVPPGSTVDADVVIQGIPYDLGTTQRPGTRFGPDAIRLASKALQWEPERWPWDFALGDRLRVGDAGDVEFPIGQTGLMASAVFANTTALFRAGRRVVSFGGDHYVSLPVLRALHAAMGPVAMLHFDAHTDTDVAAHDHHGVMFHHAAREGLIDVKATVQVGIRTYYDRQTHPYTVLDADWCNGHGAAAIVERIKATIGARPTYLTFDIDCLDPPKDARHRHARGRRPVERARAAGIARVGGDRPRRRGRRGGEPTLRQRPAHGAGRSDDRTRRAPPDGVPALIAPAPAATPVAPRPASRARSCRPRTRARSG